MLRVLLVLAALLSAAVCETRSEEPQEPKRLRDVIYGRKFGLAMTMDIYQPVKPNGAGVIFVVSGGWFSNPDTFNGVWATELLKRGYTVFAVAHGSQPKFTI